MLNLLKVLIYYPFINLLTFFIWLVPGHNAAWGIILLTLLVRFLLILPSKRAAQAQRKMLQMQPLIDELKQEYGEDKQGLAAAQMDLYKKNSINPFGSCLPLLIQFPVLIVLYRAILNGLTPHNPHVYSWVPQPAFINTSLFGINLLHPDIIHVHIGSLNPGLPGLLAILATAAQFVQMRMVAPKAVAGQAASTDPAVAMQRQSMYLFPLITLYLARTFPAGIALYWVVTTVFSIVQQYYVNKENYRLSGVDKALRTADTLHPEAAHSHVAVAEAVNHEPSQPSSPVREKAGKKGVSVTVRKKQRK